MAQELALRDRTLPVLNEIHDKVQHERLNVEHPAPATHDVSVLVNF
jgi:hypothetical protein